MNDDIRLQELFDGFAPSLSDDELFVSRLERKLALIDEVKQVQAAQIRRYRLAMVAAFVVGIVVGAGLLIFTLSVPADVPLFSFGINFYPLLLIEQNSRLILSLVASLMTVFCIVAIVNANEQTAIVNFKKI